MTQTQPGSPWAPGLPPRQLEIPWPTVGDVPPPGSMAPSASTINARVAKDDRLERRSAMSNSLSPESDVAVTFGSSPPKRPLPPAARDAGPRRPSVSVPRMTTSPPGPGSQKQGTPGVNTTTPRSNEWPVARIRDLLIAYAKDVRKDHSRLIAYVVDTTERWRPPHNQYRSSIDYFADVKPTLAPREAKRDTVKIKLKVSLLLFTGRVRC